MLIVLCLFATSPLRGLEVFCDGPGIEIPGYGTSGAKAEKIDMSFHCPMRLS